MAAFIEQHRCRGRGQVGAQDRGHTGAVDRRGELLGDQLDLHPISDHAGGEELSAGRVFTEQETRAGTPVLVNLHLGKSEFRKGAISM